MMPILVMLAIYFVCGFVLGVVFAKWDIVFDWLMRTIERLGSR